MREVVEWPVSKAFAPASSTLTARCSTSPRRRRLAPTSRPDKRAALTALWRDKQLQYTWLRSLQDRYADFWQVTGDALDFALDSLGLETPGLCDRLMGLYRTLSPFPEVPGVLGALRRAGFSTAILSNGSPAMLEEVVAGAGLGSLFDAVLSVDAVRVFKTDPRVYQYALDRLGLSASEVAFQSSNAWDAHAASDFGMRVVWCNRYGQRRERLPGAPDFEIRNLDELPALRRAAICSTGCAGQKRAAEVGVEDGSVAARSRAAAHRQPRFPGRGREDRQKRLVRQSLGRKMTADFALIERPTRKSSATPPRTTSPFLRTTWISARS